MALTEPPEPQQQFGENLKRLREGAGLTHLRLSLLSGVDGASISKLENGLTDPRLSTLVRLATGLDVELSELIRDIASRR
jgi:transcriptional regulator with XRE-family HTH domain